MNEELKTFKQKEKELKKEIEKVNAMIIPERREGKTLFAILKAKLAQLQEDKKMFNEILEDLKSKFPLTKNFHNKYLTFEAYIIHNEIEQIKKELGVEKYFREDEKSVK